MAKEPYGRFDTCRDFAAALTHGGAGFAAPTDATQLAASGATPPVFGSWPPSTPHTAPPPASSSAVAARRPAFIVGGIAAALLTVGLVAFVGARLGQPDPAAPAASPQPTTAAPWSETQEAPRTVIQTAPPVTVSRPAPAPAPQTPKPAPQPPRPPAAPPGDLGLKQPISNPSCNGQGIAILGSVTTPGLYAAGVQRLLDAHPARSIFGPTRPARHCGPPPMKAIRSTRSSHQPGPPRVRCAPQCAPPAAMRTASGWITPPIPDLSSPAERSQLLKFR